MINSKVDYYSGQQKWIEKRDGVEYLVGLCKKCKKPHACQQVIRFSEEDFQKWEMLAKNYPKTPEIICLLFKVIGIFLLYFILGFFWFSYSGIIGYLSLLVGIVLSFTFITSLIRSSNKDFNFYLESRKEIYSKYIDLPEDKFIGTVNLLCVIDFVIFPENLELNKEKSIVKGDSA